jgi:hypothetical protein
MSPRRALATSLIALLSACASSFTIPSAFQQVDPAQALASGPLCVEDFTDARSNRWTIGEARTGFDRIPIRLAVAPGVEVSRSLRAALASRGWLAGSCDAAKLVLEGTVVRFWVEERTGTTVEYSTAGVCFVAIIRDRAGKIVWAAEPEAITQSPNSLETTRLNEQTLRAALARATEEFVALAGVVAAVSGAR